METPSENDQIGAWLLGVHQYGMAVKPPKWGFFPFGIYHLVVTNIAMENRVNKWKFLAGKFIYKWAMFHGYVKWQPPMRWIHPQKKTTADARIQGPSSDGTTVHGLVVTPNDVSVAPWFTDINISDYRALFFSDHMKHPQKKVKQRRFRDLYRG